MTKFVPLEKKVSMLDDGGPIYINPDQVVTVEKDDSVEDNKGSSLLRFADGQKIPVIGNPEDVIRKLSQT